MLGAEQDRKVKNSESAGEQHTGSDPLNRELGIRTDGVNIVVNTEQENQCPRYKDREYRAYGRR